MSKKYRQIELKERKIIEKLLTQGIKKRRVQKRNHSTILYEIHEHSEQESYNTEKVQAIYEKNQISNKLSIMETLSKILLLKHFEKNTNCTLQYIKCNLSP